MQNNITAAEALERLKAGNAAYLAARTNPGDISARLRADTAEHGQHPYAAVVTCADSRVVPEHIFSAGLGEMFVIRTTGNVIGEHELAGIEYAQEHLGCKLVVILGHTGCGAVQAALGGEGEGYLKILLARIRAAIGSETDPTRASCLNAKNSAQIVSDTVQIPGVTVASALYHIDTGAVEFL